MKTKEEHDIRKQMPYTLVHVLKIQGRILETQDNLTTIVEITRRKREFLSLKTKGS